MTTTKNLWSLFSLATPQNEQLMTGAHDVIAGAHDEGPVIKAEGSVINPQDEEWVKRMELAEQVRLKPRVKPEEFRSVILKACKGYYLKTNQLTIILGRDEKLLEAAPFKPHG